MLEVTIDVRGNHYIKSFTRYWLEAYATIQWLANVNPMNILINKSQLSATKEEVASIFTAGYTFRVYAIDDTKL